MQMLKSPYLKFKKPEPKPNTVDLSFIVTKMAELDTQIQSVGTLKAELQREHDKNQARFKEEHQAKLEELDVKISQTLDAIPPPLPGKNADKVDEEALAQRVLSMVKVPIPKDGVTPVIDTLEIAKAAAKFVKVKVPEIKMPEVKIPEINHADVADRVLELIHTGKKKLSTKHIGDFTDGMEQTLRPIRSLMAGFRGGGDVVTAGSNITITTDTNGKKVITGSAGAGFTPLSATETPNGAITVFTFAAASAQPSFIISDGIWMEATGQDGTVNWTWSVGLKQSTMTIPPNSGIKGIV